MSSPSHFICKNAGHLSYPPLWLTILDKFVSNIFILKILPMILALRSYALTTRSSQKALQK